MIIPPNERRGPLHDAAVIARDFFSKTGELEFSTNGITLTSLIRATGKFQREHLQRNHTIAIHGGDWPKHRFLSMLYRTNTESIILIHHSLNYCYTRFATAIELSNIILSDDPTLNTIDLVENVIGLRSGIAASAPLMGERTAVLLAIELLLPMQHKNFRHSMEKRLDKKESALTIATRYRVPEYIAEWIINFGWRVRSDIHKELDAKK